MPKGGASSLLFQDAKIAMTKRAERERELLEPNSRPMTAPKRAPSNGKSSKGGGGGFGANGATRTALQQATDMRADTLDSEGVCLIPGVLSTDSAARLRECVADELARSYAAVEKDSSSSVARFNVPVETHDPKRGYLLLPLRDGRAVDAGEARGTLICALQELLGPNSTLGAMFSTTCGGESAELYDLVALRTEAGAARQPVHSDTPYQKVPGLFCAFIALQDVRYEMGTTMFIPKTHLQTKQRLSFDNGQFDGQRRETCDQTLRSHRRFSRLHACLSSGFIRQEFIEQDPFCFAGHVCHDLSALRTVTLDSSTDIPGTRFLYGTHANNRRHLTF
jgi:hypothetical protein